MGGEAAALRAIVELAAEHDAVVVGPDEVRLAKLDLSVKVQTAQATRMPHAALYIAMFDAREDRARPGMAVTCVGMAADLEAAAAQAAGHWCLGVLPVLAEWRGGHSCFAGAATIGLTGKSGTTNFDVLKGPIVERDEPGGGPAAAPPPPGGYLDLLAGPLAGANLARRKHWLECFAVRMADGFDPGHLPARQQGLGPRPSALLADAQTWPSPAAGLHSRRQFLLLVPDGPEEPEPRPFLARLFGRA